MPADEEPTYIQVMMSVPYNLNSYNAYLAVGVDTMFFNSTGLFDHLYYYSGPFERAPAGSLVEFTPEGGKGMYAMFRLEVLHPRRGALYVNVKCYSASPM